MYNLSESIDQAKSEVLKSGLTLKGWVFNTEVRTTDVVLWVTYGSKGCLHMSQRKKITQDAYNKNPTLVVVTLRELVHDVLKDAGFAPKKTASAEKPKTLPEVKLQDMFSRFIVDSVSGVNGVDLVDLFDEVFRARKELFKVKGELNQAKSEPRKPTVGECYKALDGFDVADLKDLRFAVGKALQRRGVSTEPINKPHPAEGHRICVTSDGTRDGTMVYFDGKPQGMLERFTFHVDMDNPGVKMDFTRNVAPGWPLSWVAKEIW